MRLLVALLAVSVLGFFVAGSRIEGRRNRVVPVPLGTVAPATEALHRSATIVDLHADPLLWDRDLAARSSVGQVDLPRLRAGGVALQVFGLVTSFPIVVSLERNDTPWPDAVTLLGLSHLWPIRSLWSRTARALHQAAHLKAMADASSGRLVVVRSVADLDRLLALRARDPEVVGALLGIEGAHALDGELGNLGRLYDAGVRMIGLAHVVDNDFAGSAHGAVKGGLSAKGRALVAEAERRGMLIDLAHTSATNITDVLAIARHPPVVSHTGVRGTCDNTRNLSDDQIRAIARAGGVIGIGYWETAVCGLTPGHVAAAIRYVVRLVGDTHVALGSDFDGAVTTGFDTSQLAVVTQALVDAGLGDEAIRRILGGNALRVLRQGLQPVAPST